MSILAIIPARSGSKRLPGKNIKTLCGKPLIQWTIDAARAAVTKHYRGDGEHRWRRNRRAINKVGR